MFKYKNKEYTSASEALDDYIRNFDFQNYENELSLTLTKAITNNANNNEVKALNNINHKQKSCLILKNSTNTIQQNEEPILEEDHLAIQKIESLINVLSDRIDEHKKQNNALTSDTNLDSLNYNEMKMVNEIQHNSIKPTSIKLLDMKIKDDIDVTNKQVDSIKESLFVFESINKKFNETSALNKKLINDEKLSSSPPSFTTTQPSTTSETKANFINECMKIIDKDELLRFPTLAHISNNLQQNENQNQVNKMNDSGLDSLLNEIKGALK